MDEPYRLHYKRTINLALPIILSHLGHMMTNLADSIMIGRVGAVPLAAASLGFNLFIIIFVFGVGISIGITPRVAAADGRKQYRELKRLLVNGMILTGGIALLLFAVMMAAAPVLRLLNQPPEVVDLAIPYFRILLLSMIPLMIYQGAKQFAEGLSLTRWAMYITLLGNLFNVILNYLFIYGKLGLPAMGLNGAGWATTVARTAMAAAMVGYIAWPKISRHYGLSFQFRFVSWSLLKKLLSLGFPIGLQMVFEVGAFTGAAVMVGWISAEALAAHQIAISLAATTFMVASGLGAAATVRVGNYYGTANYRKMYRAGFSAYHMSAAFMGLTAIAFVVLRHWLPALFVAEQSVIQITAGILLIVAVFQLSDGFQVVGLSALRGLEDVRLPTGIALFAYWMVGLPVGYVLGIYWEFGAQGVWMGLLAGLSTAAFLLTLRFYSRTRALMQSQQWRG